MRYLIYPALLILAALALTVYERKQSPAAASRTFRSVYFETQWFMTKIAIGLAALIGLIVLLEVSFQ